MFDYLQKFNALPQNLRDSVSSPSAMAIISDLEKKYKIDLAAIVMKVMVKTIQLSDLPIIFISDFSLDQDSAKKLTAELKEKLFFIVSNYLGYNASYSSVMPKVAPVSEISIPDRVIKESGIIFAGADLSQRFRGTLNTYLKGIRSRIDTRITLSKEIISGGLGLDHKTIDKIFSLCDKFSHPQENTISEEASNIVTPKSGLDKVRALYEKPAATRDIPYDLSAAIAKGEIKKPVSPFNLPIPKESQEKMLDEPEEELFLVAPHNEATSPKASFNPIVINKPIRVVTPTPEVKAPIIPEVKTRFTSEIKTSPVTTAPIAPVIPITPIAPVNPVKPVVNPGLEAITPVTPPKIIKPAESVSLWSKLFGKKEVKMEIRSMPKAAPVSNNSSSVATRRMEAIASFKSETPKNSEIQMAKPRQMPRVMSPIDELKYLDLVNFRRLGTSPAEAIAKIDSKIKLLEKDGYEKKISGIMAWKQNPINKIYLKMGQDALKKGQSLKDYAISSQNAKTPGLLSWEEIELIIKLNNQFMF